jgi:hypothetical protein
MRDEHVLQHIHSRKRGNRGKRPMAVIHWELLLRALGDSSMKKICRGISRK